jgi:putative heme-binding domain-containing protein
MNGNSGLFVSVVLASLGLVGSNARGDEPLTLPKSAHVAIVGNTLADRMQHDGWLEATLQARFPSHGLTIRNLGFSGDELTTRLRSQGFGTPDEWLAKVEADVILAFFGYNESFAGEAGLDRFKDELQTYLKQTLAKTYHGNSHPSIILFSPTAQEAAKGRDLPDPTATNARLAAYSQAMSTVAKSLGVRFVDLFTPTKALLESERDPLTINGVHLTEEGNRRLAAIIDRALFANPARLDDGVLEKIRRAVLEKNFTWFNRYRTVDGFSIYGGRADLRFVGGQTNRVVMDREMEVLDVMTVNRDRRIWAVAQGRDLAIDDRNLPPFIPVETNKPGDGPGGTHLFLGGEEAIGKMTVAKGLKVNLFASEETFPELAKPVQMAFDARGRLWVACWPTYPHWKPTEPMDDKLIILEDTDGDGKADKRTVFAGGLHCPTGFEFARGGVLVAQAPDLMWLKDTNGDDVADVRERVLSGLDSADTHHTANSFTVDPGGAIYFQEGTFHHTQVETPYGPPVRCVNAGVFRYEPKSQKFDVYVSYGFANPHGHAFDRWGQDIIVDGTGAVPYHGALFSGHVDFPNKHSGPPSVYRQRTRPCPGVEFLSSAHFPEEFQGNLIVPNVIGVQGLLRYKIDDKDSSLVGDELEPILTSTDPNFRPSDVETGPDGALYFLDWQNPIIGHMQHNLRDPSRDRTHGRVYRVTYEGRPLARAATIAGQPIPALLDLLKSDEDRVRHRAKLELSNRDTREVLAAAARWVETLDKADPNYEHHLLEALWLHQYHDVVDLPLLGRVLKSTDFRARAAATRVLCYWRDRVPDALGLLKGLAADAYPRVRLEAVRASSFFPVAGAVEVPLISTEQPSDPYLEYTRNETFKTLEPYWRRALASGTMPEVSSAAGAKFFLTRISVEELLKLKRTAAVDLELLRRPGVRDEVRKGAIADLAKSDAKSATHVLIEALRRVDEASGVKDASVVYDLARLLTSVPAAELSKTRAELEAVATRSSSGLARQVGYLSLIAADGGVEPAWRLASASPSSLRDLVDAMPLIRDPAVRASLYPRVAALLDQGSSATAKAGVVGRFIRVELKGRRTLTLAEVEVQSDGRNVAPLGKARQKNTSYGGEAQRGVDGNKDGSYEGGGQTHSAEETLDPWWELDLGSELPIDAVTIFNRTDGELGKRLDPFTLRVLDNQRKSAFVALDQEAPAVEVTIEFGGSSPEGILRRAAMNALVSVRGREAETFTRLARFVQGGDRSAATRALLRIPTAEWPVDQAEPLLKAVLAHVRTIPEADRTSTAALDELQLGDALASLLPRERGLAARRELGALGTRIIRLGTVTDQMLFDKERIAAAAGKPVEIVFENGDIMPHNFVITRPGALERVGLLAEAAATRPDAATRQYVPDSPDILVKSRLLAPRQGEKIRFTTPSEPGVYPYVCTYPGHWRRMYGAFYVVADLEAYLADPTGYLAAHPLPIRDSLLKDNRPRKEWTYDDLASSVEGLDHGRSYGGGKQIFAVASCVSCHKMGDAGVALGPDLTALDPKTTRLDLLRSLLDPSARIDEKFQTQVFATKSGQVVTGLVVEETPELVKVVENPLARAEPVTIRKTDIDERSRSSTSIMPKGLLDKLTREEILDLVAYLAARGDAKSPLFQSAHGHAH